MYYDYDCIGFDDDSVILYNGSEIWPTRWYAFTEALVRNRGTPHAVDLYLMPASSLKLYQRLETYHSNETFYANYTRVAANIDGIYLRAGTTFHFNITASSGNLTTTNGRLLVFTSNPLYHEYVDEGLPYKPIYNDFVPFNYSIGAENKPLKTNISVRVDTTSYHYFACALPANSTFSFNASFYALRYNYSVVDTKMVTLEVPDAGKYFYVSDMNSLR